jgi:hypothetical protein
VGILKLEKQLHDENRKLKKQKNEIQRMNTLEELENRNLTQDILYLNNEIIQFKH